MPGKHIIDAISLDNIIRQVKCLKHNNKGLIASLSAPKGANQFPSNNSKAKQGSIELFYQF